MEFWKDVIGLEDYYQVSNLGNVRSKERFVIRGRGGRYKIECKNLNPSINSDGYLTGIFRVDKNPINYKVHRILAESFIGSIPEGFEVNHINGIKTDNRLENLEIVSKSKNIKHAFDLCLNKPRRGELNGMCKIDSDTAKWIKEMTKNGFTESQISSQLNVSIHTVRDIRRGRTWKHV
jgi:hypothetical protein